MKRILWGLVLGLASPSLAGEIPAGARQAWEELARPRTLRARFTQEQRLAVLSQPLVSTGTLLIQRPDKLAWRTTSPAPSTFLVSGSVVSSAWPELGIKETIDLGKNPDAMGLVQAMTVWMSGDLDAVARDYQVAFRAGPPDVATLTPTNPRIASMLSRIELTLSGSPRRVTGVQVVQPDGDVVKIRLESIEVDPTLPADAFRL